LSAGSGSSGSSSVFYGVFKAEEVDRVGEKGSGDTMTVDVQTLLEIFLNMFLTSTCFNEAAFFCAKTTLSSSARLSGFPNYWIPDYRNFTAINNNNNDDDNNNNNNSSSSMVS